MTKISEELINKLKKPLPPEAISPHPTKPYLSTIKAIYVIERLNEVFGLGGWFIKNEVVEAAEKNIVIKATFTAPEYNIVIPDIFGGNDNPDRGDAYKGACTDALTKIGSYLYIGMDVFKGLSDRKDKVKAGDIIQVSPTQQKEIPACSICGGAMIKKKYGNNFFWICQDNWQKHKERGEKPKPLFKKDFEQEIIPIIDEKGNKHPF